MSSLENWLFEYQLIRDEGAWTPVYNFDNATGWFWNDLGIMNVWLARAEVSYLPKSVVTRRLLLDGESGFDGKKIRRPGIHVEDGERAGSCGFLN